MRMDTTKRLLNDVEAAQYIGVSPLTLRRARWIGQSEGLPPHVYIGRRMVRYDVQDLDRWIESRKVAG